MPKDMFWHRLVQYRGGVPTIQSTFCLETGSFGKKHQLSSTSELWIWDIIHYNGLVVDCYDLSLPSLSWWWLSCLLQKDHLFSHHTLSPTILRYHLLKHLLLLTMLLGWIYLLKLAHLVLVWKSLQWWVTHDFILWRIGWTSIRLGSLLSLSITSIGLIALRIA